MATTKKVGRTSTAPDPVFGVREVPLLPRKKKPVGHVAYCNPCNWSTGILIGTFLLSSTDRADILLKNHLKSNTHKSIREAGRELQKASSQVDEVGNGSEHYWGRI